MKSMRNITIVIFLLGLSQTSEAQKKVAVFDNVTSFFPYCIGKGMDSHENIFYGFYDNNGIPFLEFEWFRSISGSIYEVPRESDVVLEYCNYVDGIKTEKKYYNTYRNSSYYGATIPVKVSSASFGDNAPQLTSISFHENIQEIRGHFSAPNLKEILYYPNTLFNYIDFSKSKLQYLTIYNERFLDNFYTSAFYAINVDSYDVGNDRYYRCVVTPSSSLEYIVSYMDTPSPRSFYGVDVNDMWSYSYDWIEPFHNDTLCIFGKDLSELDLYVPEGSIELYRQTADWNKFRNIHPLTAEMKQRYEEVMTTLKISEASKTNSNEVKQWYSINGQALLAPQKGINIAVMRDGTVRKVYKK